LFFDKARSKTIVRSINPSSLEKKPMHADINRLANFVDWSLEIGTYLQSRLGKDVPQHHIYLQIKIVLKFKNCFCSLPITNCKKSNRDSKHFTTFYHEKKKKNIEYINIDTGPSDIKPIFGKFFIKKKKYKFSKKLFFFNC